LQVYEFVHSQLTHNRTYAFRLPPTLAEQARHHVNVQQGAIFGSDEIGSIANIAGRTLLRSILNALSRVAYNGDPLQLHLTEAPYQPFISLMQMLELDNEDPTLRGLRESLCLDLMHSYSYFSANFASALAIELRRGDEDDSRDYLRFRFKNGTADGAFRTFHAFGHSGDIPLAEFIYRTQPYQIANSVQLRTVCGGGSLVETAQAAIEGNVAPAAFGGAIAFALLTALFVLAKARKAAYGRIRLAEVENGKIPARF
jgi:lysosomal acid phosphatase